MKFFQRLKDLREEKGLTQKEIAYILNTTQRQYSRWETGEFEMPVSNYLKLAIYYNISLDYITGLTKERRQLKTERR